MRRKCSTAGQRWQWAVGLACGLAWLLLSVGAAQAQTLETKLLPLVGISADQFGVSAAVSGDVAVVGSVRGSANIFIRGFGVWTQQVRLTSPDSNGVADYFGSSVAVSGDTVVVGAYLNNDHGRFSGSVYIFTRGAFGVWTQQAKLTQADGTNGDQFGYSVALSGDTLMVGANGDNDRGIFSGST